VLSHSLSLSLSFPIQADRVGRIPSLFVVLGPVLALFASLRYTTMQECLHLRADAWSVSARQLESLAGCRLCMRHDINKAFIRQRGPLLNLDIRERDYRRHYPKLVVDAKRPLGKDEQKYHTQCWRHCAIEELVEQMNIKNKKTHSIYTSVAVVAFHASVAVLINYFPCITIRFYARSRTLPQYYLFVFECI
jgi:hypothetical protein